jgi:type II secretory pathway component PulF
MSSFRFEAKNRDGVNISGKIEAPSEREAIKQLQGQGLFIMRLREQPVTYEKKRQFGIWRSFFAPVIWPVSPKASAIYFHSFASMLESGISIRETALTLAQRAPARVFKRASAEMAEAALHGDSIVTIMPRYPAGFPPFVIAMLDAGDKAGKLEKAMRRLSKYFDDANELARQFRRLTLYPKILLVTFLLTLALLLVVKDIGSAMVAQWNAGKNVTLNINQHQSLMTILWTLLPTPIIIIAVWYGWRMLMRCRLLRIGVDRFKLSIPLIGGQIRKSVTSKWCSAMAMLYGAGVPLHEALVVAGEASGNAALAAVTRTHAKRVMEGETISRVMQATGDFPDLAIDMMAIGERSGRVEESLEKVAEYTAAESTDAGQKSAMIVGGIFYLVMAILIGSLVISFYMNYFSTLLHMATGAMK